MDIGDFVIGDDVHHICKARRSRTTKMDGSTGLGCTHTVRRLIANIAFL